jgi:NAD(P)-dependent dehydrogenase (short-subunit alcohol dehydrogenase family)
MAVDDFGNLTALVNNAGILEIQMRVEDMDAARLQRVFNNNIVSYFLCTKEAIRRMSTKYGGRGGAIVNVSSIAARKGAPGEYVDYAASKGAIDTFTLGVSHEVAAEGIRVNGVRPGVIYTDIHASGGEPGRVDRVKATVPMKRGGQPEEVAHAILWLLSDEASYATGTFIDITGGRQGKILTLPKLYFFSPSPTGRAAQRSSPFPPHPKPASRPCLPRR